MCWTQGWQGVIGKHGLSERNFVGEEILEICALNQFSNNEYLVPNDENLSRNLDAPSNKEMSHDRLCRDEG